MSAPESSIPRRSLAIAACLLISAWALTLAAPARADVTIKQKTVTSGMGGFGNSTLEATRVIAGDKCRDDETSTYTGRGKAFVGGKPRSTSEVMRLDRDLIWMIDHSKKEYTELTFAEMQARMKQGMEAAQAEMSKAQAEGKKAPDVEMDYKVDVDRTGKKETVNGFPAEEFIVTLSATPKNKTTGEQVPGFSMKMDEWLSNAVPGGDELAAFGKQLASKLGMDPELQRMGRMMSAQYGGGLHEMAEKMKELKGYPVRTIMTTGMAMPPGQQEQIEKAQAEAKQAQVEAKKQHEAGEKKEGVQDAAEAGASVSKGDVKGGLGGFFAKKMARAAEKKAEKQAEAASSGASAGAGGATMTMTMDVLSVTTTPAGMSFDVPAGYKKVTLEEGKRK